MRPPHGAGTAGVIYTGLVVTDTRMVGSVQWASQFRDRQWVAKMGIFPNSEPASMFENGVITRL